MVIRCCTVLLLLLGTAHARPAADAAVRARAAEALEEQLRCLRSPSPGQAIRAMIAKGLLRETRFGGDGSPVLAPVGALTVFGKRLLFVTGWAMEGAVVRKPFWRGPGTQPPHFLAVTLDAAPGDVPYTAHAVRGPDGILTYPFSAIEPANEHYARTGTTIICYGSGQ